MVDAALLAHQRAMVARDIGGVQGRGKCSQCLLEIQVIPHAANRLRTQQIVGPSPQPSEQTADGKFAHPFRERQRIDLRPGQCSQQRFALRPELAVIERERCQRRVTRMREAQCRIGYPLAAQPARGNCGLRCMPKLPLV